MGKSIKELREICQRSREDRFYQLPWPERRIYRNISIYFTKAFLKLKVSANQVSALSFLVAIFSGFFFIVGGSIYFIVGAAALFISTVLDCSDGEVARYNKSASPAGLFMDGLLGEGIIIWYITLTLFFGIFREIQNPLIFFFVILAIVSMATYTLSEYRPYFVLHVWGKLSEVLESKQTMGGKVAGKFDVMKHTMGYFFDIYTFLPFFIALFSLLDLFIAPFTLNLPLMGALVFNFRFIYMALFAMAWAVAAILIVRKIIKEGIKFIPKYMGT